MSTLARSAPPPPTRSTNQPPPLEGRDLFADNAPLREALEREGARLGDRAPARGRRGSGAASRWPGASQANEHPPVLHTHDRFGRRHRRGRVPPRLARAMAAGDPRTAARAAVDASREPGAHVARAALYMCAARPRPASAARSTMTFAAVPALRAQPELAAEWDPRLTAAAYDPELKPAAEKRGRAVRHGDDREAGRLRRARQHHRRASRSTATAGGEYALTGHKWFCCGADVRPVPRPRAHGRGRLSCFARAARPARRHAQRGFQLQRLKDKLGNRSNASSEVEFARRLGAAGRRAGPRRADDHRDGQPHAAGLRDRRRRRHARRRRPGDLARRATARAFGSRLVDQPLMRNVLADLAVESEAATRHRAAPRARLRRGAPATTRRAASSAWPPRSRKYWICKRGPRHAAEALECLGGNGYVEESGMPRLLPRGAARARSGRARATSWRSTSCARWRATPAALDAFLAEVDEAAGADAAPRRVHRRACATRSADPDASSSTARAASSRTWRSRCRARCWSATPTAAVADAFCAARLGGDGRPRLRHAPGRRRLRRAIVERHTPAA